MNNWHLRNMVKITHDTYFDEKGQVIHDEECRGCKEEKEFKLLIRGMLDEE